MRRAVAIAALAGLAGAPVVRAQQLSPPTTGGVVALDRALSHLASNKRLLVVAAHPDDENNELLTLASRGLGVDVAYFSLSRGEGGQNLIGTELGEGLGLIRTGELLAARSVDGGRQFFSRAYDFGFSKTLEETDRFWPRDTTLADLLRVIRRFRPQVIMETFSGTARDGHGQHQQSGVLAVQAFELLRDSAWGPKKLYRSAFFDTNRISVRLPSGVVDPADGRTYVQLAVLSRSQHRSQDMGGIQRLGPSTVRLMLVETADGRVRPGDAGPVREESGLFEGVDTSLAPGLARYAALVDSARAALGPRGLPRVTALLARALAELRRNAPAEFRALREPALEEAIVSAAGIAVDAAADDGTIVPGQDLNVTLSAWSGRGLPLRLAAAAVEAPAGWLVRQAPPLPPSPASPGTPGGAAPLSAPGYDVRRMIVTAPADAPVSEPYFLVRPRQGPLYDWSSVPDSLRGEPFDPPLLVARFDLDVGGAPVTVYREVSWRYADQASGEVRRPIYVVPAVAVSVSPDLLVWPVQSGAPRAVTVELTHWVRGTTSGELRLEMPGGWPAVPPQPFTLDGEGTRRSVTFQVRPPDRLAPGSYDIHAVATVGRERYDRGLQLVDYPHIRPVQYTSDATVRVQAASLELPPLRHVGYVRGAADVVPEALQAVGVPVTVLTAADLERADLARFDVIVVGSRAYEVDPALIANNARLLDYARAGGRLIVQYQQYQFVRGNYAPFPLTIASPHDRVTDETSPVRVLRPDNPMFRTPNTIGAEDWDGWVQERGLYFAHTWDSAYAPMLEMGDPGETQRGGMLVARLGRGLYVYTGLSFFRELPSGVPGAYRLFANLLGLEPANVP